ncbi:transmembrane reductase CYB561D2-like [Arctopsyche grandis]|uniref:transmembrane reductase CYB561D2-like n=1 Tax=Arctopsyche grandis TaxID=121162 RepID=UPI00406D9EE7
MSVTSTDAIMQITNNGQSNILDHFGRILNTLNHALIAIVTFYTCWVVFTQKKIDLFELHIALTTLGYQFLMAETIIALAGENSWTYGLKRSTKKIIHWAMAIIGSCLSIAGTSIIIYSRNKHFSSTHGILGLTAMVLLVPTFMNGPLTLFSRYCNKSIKPVYMKIYHIITALAAYCVGVSCLITGFQKKWFIKESSKEFSTCFVVFTSITIILTAKVPVINIYKLIKGMFMR